MPPTVEQFWEIAVRERFIADAQATEALTLAETRGWTAEQTAREHIGLNPAIIGIIQALQNPLEHVPGYELLGHLGHGGMGVVYRARQLAFDRTVALKTVLVGPDANSSMLQRFEQEARTVGKLIHPHLVTAYDFTRIGGRYALAMEFLDGRDAERWRHQRLVTERQVWSLIRQAAAGLAHAAAAGVIHRDVKPSNLLLVPPPLGFPLPPDVPLLKVADFGLALLQDASTSATRITRDNVAVGSPLYMAPEQLMGERVDHRADIYALGGTAYYLLTSEAPCDGLSIQQILARKLHGEPRPIESICPDISESSREFVYQMLQRDPDQRPRNYDEIFQRIDQLLAILPTQMISLSSDSKGRTLPSTTPVDRYSATQVVGAVNDPGMDSTPSDVTSDSQTCRNPALTPTRSIAQSTIKTPPHVEASIGGRTSLPAETVPPSTRRRWLIAAGGLASLWVGGALWRRRRRAPEMSWIPSGWVSHCFDGQSLNGWRIEQGTWLAGTKDEEGGAVLAGSQGSISFETVRRDGEKARPLRGFRLIFLVRPRDVSAVEIQWAIAGDAPRSSAARYYLRLESGQISIGQRTGSRGSSTETYFQRTLPNSQGRYEIKLEFHGAPTKAFLNGEELAAIPAPRYAITPEFILAAEAGSSQTVDTAAWFSDIVLEELVPHAASRP